MRGVLGLLLSLGILVAMLSIGLDPATPAAAQVAAAVVGAIDFVVVVLIGLIVVGVPA